MLEATVPSARLVTWNVPWRWILEPSAAVRVSRNVAVSVMVCPAAPFWPSRAVKPPE
jgi:hypothetical protein